ncbi:unnamed protein product [Calypogeia fissa]
MERSALYRCSVDDVWRRQTGKLHPTHFARKIGGCEDLIKRLQLYGTLDGHVSCVNTVHFNPTGDLLVSGSDDKDIVIWDWASKTKKLSYYSGHSSNVFQARIMPFSDDRSIVSCAADGQVRHSQILENGRVETKKLAKHRGRAHKLAIEPGSSYTFFSCAEDGVVRHFDLREDKSNKLVRCLSFQGSNKTRQSNALSLNAIVINPRNPNYFSVGGSDEYARVYDIRKVDLEASRSEDQPVDYFTPKHLIGSQGVHITCVAYSEQEELLVSYNDELIYKFDKGMGLGSDPAAIVNEAVRSEKNKDDNDVNEEKPQVYEGHRNMDTVKGVSYFGPNSEYVVSGSDCGRIFIWKKRGGELVAMMKGDNEVVNCLEPHPFATYLATSGIEASIKIWAPTAERLQPLPADAEKTMQNNRRRRENRLNLRPRVIMHVMQLQRRQAQRDEAQSHVDWYNLHRGSYEGDDDDDMDFMDSNSSDDDSSEEGARIGPRECIIT